MTSSEEQGATNTAIIRPFKNISKIWLVPIVSLLIGIWIIFYQINNQGQKIEIAFETAAGLEAGKTKIKIRDVVIGVVENIELNEDSDGVIVIASIGKKSAKLLKTDTRFWVVSPRVSFSGISGLQTLLSGAYINMAPGINGKESRQFTALKAPPITPVGTPGKRIELASREDFTFKAGDQIVYQGLPVGRLESVHIDLQERVAKYGAFIQAPFDELITENTRFWKASGVDFQLGADGIEISTASLETLLSGGITFGILEGMTPGKAIEQDSKFQVFSSYNNAVANRFKEKIYYMVLVESSVRGLKKGAPVEYRGVQVGQVEEVNIKFEVEKMETRSDSFKVPVLISVEPERTNLNDDEESRAFIQGQIDLWISQGLRASLKTGNLLTGALFVDLQHHELIEPYVEERFLGYTVVPIVPDSIGLLAEQVNTTLGKFNELPLQALTQDMRLLLQELSKTSASFNTTSQVLSQKLTDFDMKNLNGTLQSLDQLLSDLSDDSESLSNVNETMEEFQATMRELMPLLQKLNTSPNSLIFKNRVSPDIEPRGVNQ